jgi:hypothetical protein
MLARCRRKLKKTFADESLRPFYSTGVRCEEKEISHNREVR